MKSFKKILKNLKFLKHDAYLRKKQFGRYFETFPRTILTAKSLSYHQLLVDDAWVISSSNLSSKTMPSWKCKQSVYTAHVSCCSHLSWINCLFTFRKNDNFIRNIWRGFDLNESTVMLARSVKIGNEIFKKKTHKIYQFNNAIHT